MQDNTFHSIYCVSVIDTEKKPHTFGFGYCSKSLGILRGHKVEDPDCKSRNRAILIGLYEALDEAILHKPNRLCFIVNNEYAQTVIYNIENWANNNWKTRENKDIAHRDIIMKIYDKYKQITEFVIIVDTMCRETFTATTPYSP